MLWTASSVLQWPSKWCLSYDYSFLPLLFSGVMWMSKLTSLPALLPKNIDKLSYRPMCLKGHQPCNEFTGCVLFKIYISMRQQKFYFPKVETFDAQRKPLGRFFFASRTTCWKDQQKTYIAFSCWLIHVSISFNLLLKAVNFSPLLCDGGLTFENCIRKLSV